MSNFDGSSDRVDGNIKKNRTGEAEVIILKTDGSPLD